jgi:hypothetical protein
MKGTATMIRGGRPVAIAVAGLFAVSSAFPVVAGLAKDTAAFPKWWGVADVAVAAVLAILACLLVGYWDKKTSPRAVELTYRAYRVLTHALLATIVVFFLLGDRVVWINCLPGFAWRTWLLLYAMPAWFTAVTRGATE